MRSYEDYEKACEEVRRTNSELLQIFEEELKAKGLSSKTIRNHMENVELYISDYLLREEAQPMEKGVTGLDGFFYFYIHRCIRCMKFKKKKLVLSHSAKRLTAGAPKVNLIRLLDPQLFEPILIGDTNINVHNSNSFASFKIVGACAFCGRPISGRPDR